MSGHSKWKTIKRQKGSEDQKRGQIFTKLSNAIIIAVKQGGGITDPGSNFKLRLAIDAAHAQNMPKENIERAIDKGSGKKEGGSFEELVYEGFAPGGVSVVVEAATDNSMRTTSEIKSLFNKSGASFGQPGSSSYQFKKVGQIVAHKDKPFDDIFSLAVEAGAEDIEEAGDEVYIYTDPNSLGAVKDKLTIKGLNITDASFALKPNNKMKVEDKNTYDKVINFLSSLEDMDDVQKVYSNLEV